jgi:hypothetical protein
MWYCSFLFLHLRLLFHWLYHAERQAFLHEGQSAGGKLSGQPKIIVGVLGYGNNTLFDMLLNGTKAHFALNSIYTPGSDTDKFRSTPALTRKLYCARNAAAYTSEADMLAIANERESLRDGTHNATTPSFRVNDGLGVSSPAVHLLRSGANSDLERSVRVRHTA